MARFLAELESDHLHSVPDSPGRSVGGGVAAMQKTGDKMMAGIQEGIRQRCWIGNGPDSLKPIKQSSKGQTARERAANDKMTVAGYTFNDRFSDTSKLHDELDFDKIVNSPNGPKVVHKNNNKTTKDRY